MNVFKYRTPDDATLLGHLAMEYRGNRDENNRRRVAAEYADAVARLIASGSWEEAPSLEDMLPDEWMPKAFYDYWLAEPTAP